MQELLLKLARVTIFTNVIKATARTASAGFRFLNAFIKTCLRVPHFKHITEFGLKTERLGSGFYFLAAITSNGFVYGRGSRCVPAKCACCILTQRLNELLFCCKFGLARGSLLGVRAQFHAVYCSGRVKSLSCQQQCTT